MTGYAAREGAAPGVVWSWEMRSVNAKGLDLRLRLPERMGEVETALRARLSKALGRGNVSLSLRLSRAAEASGAAVAPGALTSALSALAQVQAAATDHGVDLAQTSAADLLALPGVYDPRGGEMTLPAAADLMTDFDALLTAFQEMRAREGAALAEVLSRQINEMEALVEAADARAAARQDNAAERLRAQLKTLLDATDLDEARLAQELAIQTVKGDVTEEIDRLRAHIAAATEHLSAVGPIGRKLDFLMQEFNREANTLCAKAADTELTRIGLDLKLLIDQMREQVQNVE